VKQTIQTKKTRQSFEGERGKFLMAPNSTEYKLKSLEAQDSAARTLYRDFALLTFSSDH
jgi:hypothetical protein